MNEVSMGQWGIWSFSQSRCFHHKPLPTNLTHCPSSTHWTIKQKRQKHLKASYHPIVLPAEHLSPQPLWIPPYSGVASAFLCLNSTGFLSEGRLHIDTTVTQSESLKLSLERLKLSCESLKPFFWKVINISLVLLQMFCVILVLGG